MVQSLGLSSATRFFCADRLNSPGNPHLKPEEQFGGFVNAVSQFGESAGHALVAAAYALHIGGGFAGLVSGFVAVFAPKGGRLHRVAGTVFVAAMTVMAAFALVISLVLPDPVNLVISVFAFYLIFTAWLTVRRRNGRIGLAEKGALVLCLILLAPFATLSFQLMTGLKPFLTSSVALKGRSSLPSRVLQLCWRLRRSVTSRPCLPAVSPARPGSRATYGACVLGSPWLQARPSPTDSRDCCRPLPCTGRVFPAAIRAAASAFLLDDPRSNDWLVSGQSRSQQRR